MSNHTGFAVAIICFSILISVQCRPTEIQKRELDEYPSLTAVTEEAIDVAVLATDNQPGSEIEIAGENSLEKESDNELGGSADTLEVQGTGDDEISNEESQMVEEGEQEAEDDLHSTTEALEVQATSGDELPNEESQMIEEGEQEVGDDLRSTTEALEIQATSIDELPNGESQTVEEDEQEAGDDLKSTTEALEVQATSFDEIPNGESQVDESGKQDAEDDSNELHDADIEKIIKMLCSLRKGKRAMKRIEDEVMNKTDDNADRQDKPDVDAVNESDSDTEDLEGVSASGGNPKSDNIGEEIINDEGDIQEGDDDTKEDEDD